MGPPTGLSAWTNQVRPQKYQPSIRRDSPPALQPHICKKRLVDPQVSGWNVPLLAIKVSVISFNQNK
jgi:hypothetical protein